ncbi:MAG TPA: GNAT family N-acetyltransferase [Devosiaceae bacterium]
MRLETERLILRPFEDRDRAPYAAFVADPEVRRFYPDTLDADAANRMIDGWQVKLERNGFHYLAMERKADGVLVGDVGLARMDYEIPGRPEVEMGWLVGRPYWGNGYAPEGARACLDHAWQVLGLNEVVAFTYRGNHPSRRVMEKIGMTRDPDGDFDHPLVPRGHRLRPHVLYRIANPLK